MRRRELDSARKCRGNCRRLESVARGIGKWQFAAELSSNRSLACNGDTDEEAPSTGVPHERVASRPSG